MKEILNEWRQFLLTEVQTLKLIDLTTSAKENGYSQNDIQLLTQFWNNNNKIRSKYSKVIEKEISDPNKNEPIAHILSAVKSHYNFVYDKLSSTEKMKLASAEDIDVGRLRVQADLAEQDAEDHEDPMKFRSRSIREQCKYRDGRPVVGRYADFDVVYSGVDWVVIEPKSVRGSIAWSHGKPDGSEETEEKYRVTWCTGTKSDNYYESYAMDYHMFYCIPVNYEELKVSKPRERRLCLAFINYEGKTYLANDIKNIPNEIERLINLEVVVDGENDGIDKEEVLLILKNNSLYSNLEKLCSKRKSTLLKEKYKNASYEDVLKRIKIDLERFEFDEDDFVYIHHCNISFIEKLLNEDSLDNHDSNSFRNIIYNIVPSRDDLLETEIGRNLLRKFVKGDVEFVRGIIAQREDLLKLEDGKEIIKFLANDISKNVRNQVAIRNDLLEADPSGNLIRTLAKDKEVGVRQSIARNKDLLNLKDSNRLVKELINDKEPGIKYIISKRVDLLKLNSGKEIIRGLAKDENDDIRENIARREDLLEVDPSGNLIRDLVKDKNESVKIIIALSKVLSKLEDSKEIIKSLAYDNNPQIRIAIVSRSDLLEIDPNREIIKDLINDIAIVRQRIATRNDLLEIDPSGEIIRKLVKDSDKSIRYYISRQEYLFELDDREKIIKSLAYDEYHSIREEIASKKDLLKLKSGKFMIKRLALDRDWRVREEISYREDLLEVDPSGGLIKSLYTEGSFDTEHLRKRYKSVFNINECLLKKKMSNFLF